MAWPNFPRRGSSVCNTPETDNWSKTNYVSDHVCQPVIIDAQGRKRPIVSSGPLQNTDFYVTKTETTVEHVLSPFVSEHKHTPYKSHDPLEGYETVEERWLRPSSPVHSHPQEVNEFLTKVQIEASKPRFGHFTPENWRQNTTPTGFSSNSGGYKSEYHNFNEHDWQKPAGNAYGNNDHDDYYSKNGRDLEPHMETHGGWGQPTHTRWGSASPRSGYSKPTGDLSTAFKKPVQYSHTTAPLSRPLHLENMDSRESPPTKPSIPSRGGWARPSLSAWATPPGSNLSKPVSDINTAMEVLKQAAKPSFSPAPNSQYTGPGFRETIDSNEAARRCSLYYRPRSYTNEDNYTNTITSKEAANKYNGTKV